MKNLLWNFTIFIVFVFTFSSLTGCPTATTQKDANEDQKLNSNTTEAKKKEGTDYPPVPSAIAQAEFKMLDGTTFKLEDQKGKVILFNLWATWCGPCRGEMPHLIEMQEKYRDKNFEIIGLDVPTDGIPESPEAITSFAKQMKLNYKLGWADNKSANEFARIAQMPGIPISVLVNREGKMTGIFAGGGAKVIKSMEETVEKTVNE
jgi:thiol-disulfide isomerase/thioredoxin